MADHRDPGAPPHIDGLRAWLAEIDRTIWKRTRLGLALFAVIACVSGIALYLAVQTSDNSATTGQIPVLQGQIDRLRAEAVRAVQINRRAALALLSAHKATVEIARLGGEVRALRQSAAAAAPTSSQSHNAGSQNSTATKKGQTAGAGKGSSANGTTVSTASNSKLGEILVDSHGLTLYDFHKDQGTKSACYGSCAKIWPPLTTSGTPQAAGGAAASLLGTTSRSDGSTQVTYSGHPLYTYVGDTKPGEATGNGLTEFGGSWHALRPNGKETGG
jgi:predicted lipoprotein with Yx(FWY)xxD motif